MVAELLQKRPSDECGCPEEDWDIDGVFTTIHLEEDGSGHIFLDGGEWDAEKLVACRTMTDLRKAATDWVASLPRE